MGQILFANAAYRSEAMESRLKELGVDSSIHDKDSRGHPLSGIQKEFNRINSSVLVAAEHVFGFTKTSMRVEWQRVIGFKRNTSMIFLANLARNIFRYEQLIRA